MDEDVDVSVSDFDIMEPLKKRLKVEDSETTLQVKCQNTCHFETKPNSNFLPNKSTTNQLNVATEVKDLKGHLKENIRTKRSQENVVVVKPCNAQVVTHQFEEPPNIHSPENFPCAIPVVKDLKKQIKTSLLPIIPCFMVMEVLQGHAREQGYKFKVNEIRKRKRSLPYAETDWFYNSISTGKHHNFCSKKSRQTISGCKDLLVKAHQLKANKIQSSKKNHSMFEVEYIANFKVIEGKRYYLVKWVGWPTEANTWEPASNLSCSGLIEIFHEDYMRKLSEFLKKKKLTWHKLMQENRWRKHVLQRLYNILPNNFHFVSDYAIQKQQLFLKLKAWQRMINQKNKGLPVIAMENEVDLEPLPDSFNYVVNNIAGKGVLLPTDPLIGCECTEGCESALTKGKCCPGFHKGKFPYQNGLIRLRPGRPIFECNSRCKCGPECPNRIVQKGPQTTISLFRTSNGKGWGVKALQPIVKGTFVMEYVGEIITNDEAERRGKEYDSNGITYLFDLDFCDSENPLTVDATNFGNISHFVNHSCSPNLQVYNVFIDNLDPSLPRIALFAKKSIAINEELTFDYQMTGDMTDGQCVPLDDGNSNVNGSSLTNGDDSGSDVSYSSSCSSIKKRTRCLCGSSHCRKWLI